MSLASVLLAGLNQSRSTRPPPPPVPFGPEDPFTMRIIGRRQPPA